MQQMDDPTGRSARPVVAGMMALAGALLTPWALLLLVLGLLSGQIVTRVIHQALPAVLG